MSKKTSRNAPCPCGSGQKYKKCCLAKDEAASTATGVADAAVGRALEWLREHHAEAVERTMFFEFFESLTDEQLEEVNALPEDLRDTVHLNALEWVLAEGEIDPTGAEEHFVPVMELVLGEGGPLMDVNERRYLELLATEPLGLYEVVDVVPGDGVWLVSTLADERERFWVRERTASQSLREGDILAARVLPSDPAVLSGAVYPFNRPQYLPLRGRILEGPRERGGQLEADWVSAVIIEAWLSVLVGPPPALTHASTGEPMLLTTIHYRVTDWSRLVQALDEASDVRRDDDDHWVRLESQPAHAEMVRPLCSLYKSRDDRLELFAQTTAAADAAEAWFSKLAGDTVEHIAREVVDPTHVWKHRHEQTRGAPDMEDEPADAIPPEAQTEMMQQVYRQTYANWADEPIPALKNKTPRQAMRSKAGRREVIELLRSYEFGEREQAERERREPCDLSFLWDELGLSDEG